MLLKTAEFDNFRNIEHFKFDFDERMNILFGKNAQGKTNVIEGIYLFAGGKSFRKVKDADMRRFGSSITQAQISFDLGGRENKMAYRLSDRAKRELFVNGSKLKRSSEFIGRFRAVLFCPAHLSIVQADPAVRRQFIDGAISQLKPRYLSSLIMYQKVMEQRNALLRSCEKNPTGVDLMYDVLTEKMAELAGYITAERASYLKRLFHYVNELMKDMSDGKEDVGYKYLTSISDISGGDLFDAAENTRRYIELVPKYREKEKIVGTSLIGAQRDDFEIELCGKEAKHFASQGQQRSIALSLKLSEGEISKEDCGEYPVFLFDDVLSELDKNRKNYVLSRLYGRQVIITSCDENDFSDANGAKKIYVDNGRYHYI